MKRDAAKRVLNACSRMLVFSLVSLLGSSCSVNPEILVFNHTRSLLRVTVDGKQLAAGPGAVLSLTEGGDLVVRFAAVEATYALPIPPPEYVRTRLFRAQISVQLEPDARLFVLAPGDRPPIDASSYPQPPGFPVLPAHDAS
jgi:hypothetical protein